MPRLTIADRQRVIHLFKDGYKHGHIKARLEEEGIKISRVALFALLKKHRDMGRVEDRPRARVPKLLSDAHYLFIDRALEQNDELTTAKLYDRLIDDFLTLSVSKATVKRARRELGWITSAPKYCQLIRDNNKQKRLEWCLKMVQQNEDFRDVV